VNGSTGGVPLDGKVVIVGASLGGLRAAEALRAEGFSGRLVLVGEELHLPYDRPPLSKQVLAGTWPPEQAVLADRSKLASLRIEHVLGHRAVHLDAAACRVELDDGTTLEADGVVVTTGARPRRLAAAPGAFVLRTLDDSVELHRRVTELGEGAQVVVVGAGFIGSEVAATCAGLGCRVHVLEALPTPLSAALGVRVGQACSTLHLRHGVSLSTGTAVVAVHEAGAPWTGPGPRPAEGRAGRVELSDGTSVPADVVVVGIGVVPNVEWLEGSGLELDDGVVCDEALFGAARVVAAGDLARFPYAPDEALVRIEHWQVAAEQAVAAARSLIAGRGSAPPFDTVPYFWSDQYGLRIQVLGRPHPDDDVEVVDGTLESDRFVALYGRAGRLTAALAISRPRLLMAFRPLLARGASFEEAVALQPG